MALLPASWIPRLYSWMAWVHWPRANASLARCLMLSAWGGSSPELGQEGGGGRGGGGGGNQRRSRTEVCSMAVIVALPFVVILGVKLMRGGSPRVDLARSQSKATGGQVNAVGDAIGRLSILDI